MRKPDSVNRQLMAALGRRIRERREATGMTARDFAEARGWDRNLWGRVERGQQNVSVSSLHRVAAALGTTIAALTRGIEREVAETAPHAAEPGSPGADG